MSTPSKSKPESAPKQPADGILAYVAKGVENAVDAAMDYTVAGERSPLPDVPSDTALTTLEDAETARQRTARRAKDAKGSHRVRQATKWAAGVGLVPIPFVSVIGSAGIQVAMVQDLADIHGHKLPDHRAKVIITHVLGGLGNIAVKAVMYDALKMVPGVGMIAGIAAGPATNAMLTWAMGVVFHRHFRAGGKVEALENLSTAVKVEYAKAHHAVSDLLSGGEPSVE